MIKKYLPWLIAIIYLLNPFDIIPDFILGVGWLDDISVFALVLWWISRMRKAGRYRSSSSSTADSKKEEKTSGQREYSEEDPYRVLNIKRGASKEEIRAAYTELAAQYHPDKVQHLGKEFQELAHNKFVVIQKAYDELMR